ncbi:MAG: archaeosortase/exosortase family protein [Cyanobacteriota bacterium]|jgi:cyanosortase A-associated protein
MKPSFLNLPEYKSEQVPKILISLDKRFLISLVYCLFVVLQAVSLWRQNASSTTIFINILLFASGFYYYYQRRHKLRFPFHPTAQLFGGILVGLATIKIFTLHQGEIATFYWAISAPIIVIGISLLAGGFWGVKQFSRLITAGVLYAILTLVAIDLNARNTQWLVDFSARMTSYLLWYLGFNPRVQDNFLLVNEGIVKVNNPCTLIPLIITCVSFVLIIFSFFSFKRKRRILVVCLLISAALSFVLSIIRIAVMALVVNDQPSFDYWHGTSGSNLFMIIGLVGCGSYIISQVQVEDSSLAIPTQQYIHHSYKNDWLAILFLWSILVVFGLLIFSPDGGAKRLQGFSFPQSLPFSKATVLESQALLRSEDGSLVTPDWQNAVIPVLPKSEKDEERIDFRLFMAGQRYNLVQENANLNLTLTYVLGNSWKFLRIGTPMSSQPLYEDYLTALETKEPKAPFLIWQGENSTHLLSCLTARGESFVTDVALENFPQRIRETFRNSRTFYEWVSGQRLIRDSRCIWVHLFEESVNSPATNERLIALWKDLQIYWRQAFPPL